MGRPRSRRAWRRSVVILTACVIVPAVPAASGTAAITRTSAVSSKLVGEWTRKITSADIKRSYGYGNQPGTVCTLTIKKSGAAHLVVMHVGAFDGAVVSVGTNRVHFTYGDRTGNVYRWRVSRRLLTLIKIYDGTPDRATAMWGVWKRK
jgi:hypothetical protein